MLSKTLLIILSFIPIIGFSQKWHLNNFDSSKKFGYEYWFQFEHLEDTSSLISKSNLSLDYKNSIIEVIDCQDEPVVFANIKIRNLDTDSVIATNSDVFGISHIIIPRGNYEIEISAITYDSLKIKLRIDKNKNHKLKTRLGLAPELTVYQINSKEKLNETKIIEIIDCVDKNRNNFYDQCSVKELYFILTHI